MIKICLYINLLIILNLSLSCSSSKVSPQSSQRASHPKISNQYRSITDKYKRMRQRNWEGYTGSQKKAPRFSPPKFNSRKPLPRDKVPSARKKIKPKKVTPYMEDTILLEQSVSMMCFKKRFNNSKCALLRKKSHDHCHYKKLIKKPKSYQKCIKKQASSIR